MVFPACLCPLLVSEGVSEGGSCLIAGGEGLWCLTCCDEPPASVTSSLCELGRGAHAPTIFSCGAGLSKTPFMLKLKWSMQLLCRLCKQPCTIPGRRLQTFKSRLLMSPGEQRGGSWLGRGAGLCRYGGAAVVA